MAGCETKTAPPGNYDWSADRITPWAMLGGAGLAIAYTRAQLLQLTDELSPEAFDRAKAEALASGLQFIETGQGSAACARCGTYISPRDLLAEKLEDSQS